MLQFERAGGVLLSIYYFREGAWVWTRAVRQVRRYLCREETVWPSIPVKKRGRRAGGPAARGWRHGDSGPRRALAGAAPAW